MTEKELINQLKSFKNIHPDQNWVALTRSQLNNTNPQMAANAANIFERIFAFPVPKMAAIPVMALVVALVGGVAIMQDAGQEDGAFVASTRHKSLSAETKEELKEIAAAVKPANEVNEAAGYTVVFDENSDKNESFKAVLKARIENKIRKINDLFAQLEDENLAREISLSPRRYEENFKLADGKLSEQVKILLADAQNALDEGNLIDALDLTNAIEKLLD